jgi:Holliday junction resolvase-like predicted endonuclease
MEDINFSSENLPIIIISIISLGCGAYFYKIISKALSDRKNQKRFKRGNEGEVEAENFLKKSGFTIISDQVVTHPKICVDGEWHDYMIKADFLVEKNGKKAIVEVKTGKSAPSPTYSATRRQLLEYTCSYNVDTVYLFDADSKSLMEISFELNGLKNKAQSFNFNNFVFGVLIGMLLITISFWAYQYVINHLLQFEN